VNATNRLVVMVVVDVTFPAATMEAVVTMVTIAADLSVTIVTDLDTL